MLLPNISQPQRFRLIDVFFPAFKGATVYCQFNLKMDLQRFETWLRWFSLLQQTFLDIIYELLCQ